MCAGDAFALRPFAHSREPRRRALDVGMTQCIRSIYVLFFACEQVDTQRRIAGKTESTSEVALGIAVAAAFAAAAQNHETTHASSARPPRGQSRDAWHSELAHDRSAFLLHVFDLAADAEFVAYFKRRYERPLIEIFQ